MDTNVSKSIPEENDLQNLTFRSYLRRQRVFFGIPFSIYIINYVFIGICEIGASDLASFRMKSSCLIAGAWAIFLILRFSANTFKALLPFYMGIYGYIYVLTNFKVFFEKHAIMGNAITMGRGGKNGQGFTVAFYATVFSVLFLVFANLLEKEDLIGSMAKWYSEKHKK